MPWVSIEERIARTEKLINTILKDAELLAAAKTINIDETALGRGMVLAQAARAADARQEELTGVWKDIRSVMRWRRSLCSIGASPSSASRARRSKRCWTLLATAAGLSSSSMGR